MGHTAEPADAAIHHALGRRAGSESLRAGGGLAADFSPIPVTPAAHLVDADYAWVCSRTVWISLK